MTAHTPDAGPRRDEDPTRVRFARPGVRILLVTAWLVPLGVLVQAALAGQALFISPALFGLHGGIGHGVLVLAVLTAGLAWWVRSSRPAAIAASLAVLALIGQTGLGYVGHRGRVALASSLHVPLGVAILGLSVAVAVLVTVSVARTAPERHAVGTVGPDGS
jgi:hypothetical protein